MDDLFSSSRPLNEEQLDDSNFYCVDDVEDDSFYESLQKFIDSSDISALIQEANSVKRLKFKKLDKPLKLLYEEESVERKLFENYYVHELEHFMQLAKKHVAYDIMFADESHIVGSIRRILKCDMAATHRYIKTVGCTVVLGLTLKELHECGILIVNEKDSICTVKEMKLLTDRLKLITPNQLIDFTTSINKHMQILTAGDFPITGAIDDCKSPAGHQLTEAEKIEFVKRWFTHTNRWGFKSDVCALTGSSMMIHVLPSVKSTTQDGNVKKIVSMVQGRPVDHLAGAIELNGGRDTFFCLDRGYMNRNIANTMIEAESSFLCTSARNGMNPHNIHCKADGNYKEFGKELEAMGISPYTIAASTTVECTTSKRKAEVTFESTRVKPSKIVTLAYNKNKIYDNTYLNFSLTYKQTVQPYRSGQMKSTTYRNFRNYVLNLRNEGPKKKVVVPEERLSDEEDPRVTRMEQRRKNEEHDIAHAPAAGHCPRQKRGHTREQKEFGSSM